MKGGLCLFPYVVAPCLNNCFLEALCGERIPRNEQYKNLKAAHAAIEFNTLVNEYGNLLVCYPWMRYIDIFDWTSYRSMRQKSMDLYDFSHEIVEKFVNTFEEGSNRNFLDIYLNEVKEAERNGINNGYSLKQLYYVALDFIFPTFTSMGTTMGALFQHLIHNQTVLRKVQNEIDDVVGSGRLPNLDDRIK